MPAFAAFIFDLDGTLVDSSRAIRTVMQAWSLKHGLDLETVLEVCHGCRTEDSITRLAPHLCAKTEAWLIEEQESRTLEGIVPIAGAVRFVRSLLPGTWAVATSSAMVNARPKLDACGLPVPEAFITAESVTIGKPDPAPFLAAAAALGVAPQDCIVFEDAPAGVQAALAAGCRVILIGNSCPMEHARILGQADTFEDLAFTPEGALTLHGNLLATGRFDHGPAPAMRPVPAAAAPPAPAAAG